MHRINYAYELETGVTRELYVGKTDEEMWPGSSAATFVKNDKIVLKTKLPLECVETGLIRGTVIKWNVRKWPLLDRGGSVVGVCGLAERALV